MNDVAQRRQVRFSSSSGSQGLVSFPAQDLDLGVHVQGRHLLAPRARYPLPSAGEEPGHNAVGRQKVRRLL
ncbi:hypothetical protein OG393_03500 [Streptomyces sp. NBC_01216]|uniref:hypothetical protein n=1 Tax=Streptomyces sp. NBC_01216 TaxID=2903778 RepID=UPI002E113998|nr:hypothetical protein OG393_03500 [Streptomyces sp. NBC_01216]